MVGRNRPYAELNALLEAACAGHGRAALVRGEAGMGKTTLVETLAGNAEFDQTAPYLPWVPLFRHLGVVAPNREAVGGPAAAAREAA
jgi:predicted ATPase